MSTEKTGPFNGALKPAFEAGLALAFLYSVARAWVLLEATYGAPGATRASIEKGWDWIYTDVFQENEAVLNIIGMNLWGMVCFWSIGGVYSILDFTKPKWITKYSVQPDKEEPVDAGLFLKVVRRDLFNQIVVTTATGALLYPLSVRMGMTYKAADIPNLEVIFKHFVGYIVIEEIGFYYSHRLFHEVPYLYKTCHKIHHEWQAPISITAIYAHPLEHFMSNLVPLILGPVLMGSHTLLFAIWILMAHVSTLSTHSGYHVPFNVSPEAHDYHHLKFNVNYGVMGVLDLLHNTNYKFIHSVQGERHRTLLGLTPARVLYPDPPKAKSK